MQAQVKLLAIHGFQCCFTAAPVLTLYTSICVAGYKNLDAVSSFAAGDLGCLCCMLSSRKKWPLASCNGCTGGTESNSPQAGAVLGTWRGEYNLDPVFCTPPSPQSLKNMHQPDKALIPREAKEESQGRRRKVRGPALHSGRQGWRWHNRCQKNAVNRLKMEGGFFFYLSVKVYFCYSNLASILIHTECSARALRNDPESNFGIEVVWFICIRCIYPHYNCTWKKPKQNTVFVYVATYQQVFLL